MRRGFLLVIALLIALASGSSARAQAPERLQQSNVPFAIGADTGTLPQLARQQGFPDLPPVVLDPNLGEYIDGVYVMPSVARLYATLGTPSRGTSQINFYENSSCTEPRYGSSQYYLSYFNREPGFVASVRGIYSFRLDDGSYVNGYRGPCISIVWDNARFYGAGTPATPIANNGGENPPPDAGAPVVSLPNTGAGPNDGTPFLWLGIGSAVLISGFALRWRTNRTSR
jgi:hypothetical protein